MVMAVVESLNFSKTKYCGLWQCPKIAWMRKYKPEERRIDEGTLRRMRQGDEVGDLAMGLFGDYIEVTAYDGEKLDLSRMIEATTEAMAKEVPVICEASFSYEGLYCAVDILRREDDGWAIYEVKSGTHEEKPVYRADIAYQKHVLERCGITVTGTYLICLDRDYVRDGDLDLDRLFKVVDVAEELAGEEAAVQANIELAARILSSADEPDVGIAESCHDPYDCAYWHYCARNLPKPSVFDLYRMPFKKKVAYHRRGMNSFDDLIGDPNITNDKQLRQIEHGLADLPDYVDASNIADFLSQLGFPLYFLDFETMQPAIPRYDGTRPYDQVPFQYSLHFIEHEGGELQHREFLGDPEHDPRRALAEQLCNDIPMGVCTTAYNKSFECTRLKELADAYPDLAEHLLNIRDNIVDLLVPFQKGWYYNRAMGGSFSIKSVLPALFPDDPELNYANLEGIHNGGDAMTAFPAMASMSEAERKAMRRNLLEYCKLDTYAMVKVWEKLREAAQQA